MAQILGVYAGSFDPPTWGHISVAERSLSFCDSLIVAIATNTNKKNLFSPEQRKVFWEEILKKHKSRVKIEIFEGLTAQLAQQLGATVLIRGLRSSADLTREMEIAAANRMLNPKLETIFLGALPGFAFHSSSIVREIAHFDPSSSLDDYVPPLVVKALKKKASS